MVVRASPSCDNGSYTTPNSRGVDGHEKIREWNFPSGSPKTRMSQKKGVNLLVILSNLLDQGQELVHQNQHQARFGAGRHSISLQVRLMQALHNRSRTADGLG